MSTRHCQVTPIEDIDAIRPLWQALQQQASPAYFQTWGWIECWLRQVLARQQPLLLRIDIDGELIALGILLEKTLRRRHLVTSRALFLNEYPFGEQNMFIEDNRLLAKKGCEVTAFEAMLDHFYHSMKRYDELHLGAISSSRNYLEQIDAGVAGRFYHEIDVSRAWQVDLTVFSNGLEGFLRRLSRNRRCQVRRSMKLYNANLDLRIEEARTLEQALAFFERLKVLHTRYWNTRDLGGAFNNPVWERFNQCLIESRFGQGEIQLLKISGAGGEIGYVYSLVRDGHVYVIQTGFARSDDKRLMPGYVSHVLAIAHNHNCGHRIYDLMHGDNLYKQILCDRDEQLLWQVLQRRKLKFALERALVRLVRRWRGQSGQGGGQGSKGGQGAASGQVLDDGRADQAGE